VVEESPQLICAHLTASLEVRRSDRSGHDSLRPGDALTSTRYFPRYAEIDRFEAPLMAHRQFTDARGVVWDVYDVVSLPGFGRPGEPQLAPHSEVFRAARSWLAFESGDDKRRYPTIPENWEAAPAAQMQRWLDEATPVSKRSP
jgi:hypothetical protein